MTVPFLLNGDRLVLPRDACDLLSDEFFTFCPHVSCPVLSDVVLVPCAARYQGMTCKVRHLEAEEWDKIEEGDFSVESLDGFNAVGVTIYNVSADHSSTGADFVALDLNVIRTLRKTRQYPLPKNVLRELNDWSDDMTLFQVKTAMPSGYLDLDDGSGVSTTPIVIKTFRNVSFVDGHVQVLLMDSYGVVLTNLPYEKVETATATVLYQQISDMAPSRPDYLQSEPDKQFIWRFNDDVTTAIGQGPFCIDIDHLLLSESTLDVTVVSGRLMFGRPLPTAESTRYITVTSAKLSTAEWTLRVWYVKAVTNAELNVSFDFFMTENAYVNGAFAVCGLGRNDGRSIISLISYDPDGYADQIPFDRNLVVSRTIDAASLNDDTTGSEDDGSNLGLSEPGEVLTDDGDWQSSPSTFEERMNRLPLLGKLMCFALLLVAVLALIRILRQILKHNKR